MFTLSAQELKQGGLTTIKKLLKKEHEVLIQERGKDACVVIDLEYYNQLRLCELEIAYLKAQEEIKQGKFETIDNVEKHVKQVIKDLENEKSLNKSSG